MPDNSKPAPRLLIAEDESLLAKALQQQLQTLWPEVNIIARVGDGLSALQEALDKFPDILFLDIKMPGLDGLALTQELLDAWPEQRPFPLIVFVTAYDQYATAAFDNEVFDYLVKPVNSPRLQKTIQRLQQRLSEREIVSTHSRGDLDNNLLSSLRRLINENPDVAPSPPSPSPSSPIQILTVSDSRSQRIHLVPISDIVYFQAQDKYVEVLTADREYWIRTPLKELERQLPGDQFWQIHRSTIVRILSIAEAIRHENGTLTLSLHQRPERLKVSRLYAYLFKSM